MLASIGVVHYSVLLQMYRRLQIHLNMFINRMDLHLPGMLQTKVKNFRRFVDFTSEGLVSSLCMYINGHYDVVCCNFLES